MKTNIRFTGIEPNKKLSLYATKKMEACKKVLDIESAKASVCDIELIQSTKHNKGDICTAECTLEARGKVYRVSKKEPVFEKAIDKVKDDLLEQLKTDKEKGLQSFKKGAKAIKDLVHKA